jgi:FixJ family two-component response regulator
MPPCADDPTSAKRRDSDGHDHTRPRDGDRQAGLFDIEMPNVDGLEAAEQLAGEGLRRPVVVVTGSMIRA